MRTRKKKKILLDVRYFESVNIIRNRKGDDVKDYHNNNIDNMIIGDIIIIVFLILVVSVSIECYLSPVHKDFHLIGKRLKCYSQPIIFPLQYTIFMILFLSIDDFSILFLLFLYTKHVGIYHNYGANLTFIYISRW